MEYNSSPALMQSPGQQGYSSPSWYGGIPAKDNKGLFVRGQRQRLNIVPMVLTVLLPWGMFCCLFAALSFSLHYDQPWVCSGVVVLAALFVLAALWFAGIERAKRGAGGEREPSWMLFLFLSLLQAWLLSVILGDANYYANTKPYFDQQQLNIYYDVYPDRARGQQIMDAGSIVFANGSYVDVKKSMGFKNQQLFCVAPIVHGTGALPTYDFWAVGTDCCSGSAADFHCPYFNDPNARGGLRIMRDGERPYFRLAVQQAEATYNIQATHPLFFSWVPDAQAAVDEWFEEGRRGYMIGISSFLVWQMFIVAAATVAFSQVR